MNTPAMLSTVIAMTVSLLLFWLLIYRLYPDYRMDSFRQQMFGVRDELFDFARAGEISFSDPAYVLLRQTMNGFIRFGDRIGVKSICMLVIGGVSNKEEVEKYSRLRVAVLSELAPIPRQRLLSLEQQMHLLVIEHLLLSSPALMLTVVPVILGVLLGHLGKRLTDRLGAAVGKWPLLAPIDSAAVEFGAAS